MDDLKKNLERKEKKIATLEKRLQQMEKQYLEKTTELSGALEEAKSANGSRRRFLAQTSHEIRTPLNIIIGMTKLALDEIDHKEQVRDYLTKIDGSSKILLGLINDILDMSAIEDGKMNIEQKKFSLKEQITNLSVMQYQQAVEKNIHFDVELKGVTEECIIGDELRTQQILLNLLSNAFKFTKSGGSVTLKIIQASTSRDHVHMRFIVKDTGCGMTEDMKKRLFNPFEQQDASTARKFGGSGLGMSITKRLLEMMGGSIAVSSEEGVGTEFVVDIPFGKVESKEKQIKESFSKYRAIVVASSQVHCMERGTVLENMGIPYDITTDEEEALDMIGEAEDKGMPYKLCIIDWRISSVSGFDLIHEIRDIFGDGITIIGAAFEFSNSLEQGIEAGADYMVAKPVFRSTLFDALMKISKGKVAECGQSEDKGKTYSFSGKRVLLAEDVALNMEVAVKLFHHVDVTVTCVENGEEAVEVFKQKGAGYFDAIFLDINMPVMDGYEAARRIRKSGTKDAETVPIYAMTANAFTEDVTEALNVGMNGHIAKPIEVDVLYEVLDKIFQN